MKMLSSVVVVKPDVMVAVELEGYKSGSSDGFGGNDNGCGIGEALSMVNMEGIDDVDGGSGDGGGDDSGSDSEIQGRAVEISNK